MTQEAISNARSMKAKNGPRPSLAELTEGPYVHIAQLGLCFAFDLKCMRWV